MQGMERGSRPASGHRTVVALVAAATLLAGCADPDAGGAPTGPPLPVEGPATPRPEPAPEPETSQDVPGLPPADLELPELRLVEVVTLDAPVDTTSLDDGTVLVAERAGLVRVLEGAEPGRIVLDVSDRTTTDSERGLLSIAASPWGDELFLSMTDVDGDTLVEAHPLSGSTVTGPPRIIYTLAQPRANHNGGPILFLPDGTLLIGLGDGGGSGDPLGAGQDLATPLGAVVRLDVRDGQVVVPEDNPFVGTAGAAPEIVAYGLRNPWRIAFDAPRGELWISDVGQSEIEEINRVTVSELFAANFGWALREGSRSFLGDEPEDHVRPLHDYSHGPGCSVTGGLVYRGTALPSLAGGYIFSDFCDGELRMLLEDDGRIVSRPLGVSGTRIVGFGTDADGELLVLELGGRILRLAPA